MNSLNVTKTFAGLIIGQLVFFVSFLIIFRHYYYYVISILVTYWIGSIYFEIGTTGKNWLFLINGEFTVILLRPMKKAKLTFRVHFNILEWVTTNCLELRKLMRAFWGFDTWVSDRDAQGQTKTCALNTTRLQLYEQTIDRLNPHVFNRSLHKDKSIEMNSQGFEVLGVGFSHLW